MIQILLSSKIILLLSIIATLLFIGMLKYKKMDKNSAKVMFYTYISFVISLCVLYYLKDNEYINYIFLCVWIISSIITTILHKILNLNVQKLLTFLCLLIITVVQITYISYTPYYARQHDGRSFYNYENGGHFGYIGYIFYNNKLPTESPKDYWCFYNPPLFYIISATFMKIQNNFGVEIENCLENLQILTLIYVTIFNIFVYKILKEIGIEKSLVYVLSFVGLTPIMIILSGSIGNGTLSVMLSTIAIYYTIKWYKTDSFKDLLKIAFSISLAIMTKIDAALIAIMIGIVFLVKVIKNRAEIKKYIKYFSIFAIISLPIGLWYPIKNLIVYDIPITYVQSVDWDNEANISRFSPMQRFFTTASKDNIKDITITMSGEKIDYNIFLTTVKSFIIDEYLDYNENIPLNVTLHLLFFLSIVISILFVINIIYVLKNYKKINNHWILFFLGLLVIEIISYLQFCFKFPFTFTMNFRYIIPTLISYAVLTGIACENNKTLYIINSAVLTIFSILSIMMFIFIA